MKKKSLDRREIPVKFRRPCLSMRLHVVFTLFLVLLVTMPSFAQDKKVSLHVKSESLSTILIQIKDASGERIIFNENQLEKITKENVSFKDLPVKEAIDFVLKGTGFKCEVLDGVYVIKKDVQRPPVDALTITGQVVDIYKTPLPGVTVRIKNTTIGVATDMDGKYTLTVADGTENPTLVFSFVGMESQEIEYSGKNIINVTLKEDAAEIEEVVVTGMFTRRAESYTGSTATYKAETLKEIGNQNVLQSLSALDPSFVIADNNITGSDPNAGWDITINGTTSITGLSDTYSATANQPLFILDGFESNLQAISDLSMDRVESITILKDAASTAIYGAKAANGVIVVETKKPEAGELRLSYNGNYQVAWADLSDYNLMNAKEKLEFERLAGHYGKLDDDGGILDDSKRFLYNKRLARVVAGQNSYWMNEPLRTAYTHEHSISMEGGDIALRYGLTFRYKNNQGVMKKSNRQNIDGVINLFYRVDKFNLSNQTTISYTDAANNTVPFSSFSRMNPYEAKYAANGEIQKVLEENDVYNPLWDFIQKSYDENDALELKNNFIIEYRPITQMRVQGKFGFNTSRSSSEIFKSPYNTEFIGTESTKQGSYNRTEYRNTAYDGSVLVSFGEVSGIHTYNLIAGTQLSASHNTSEGYSAIGYTTDQFSNPNFSNSYPEGEHPSSSVDKYRSASFYFNGNYAFDMRYLLDVNLRSDGASVFGVNNPFSTTWSLGVGWNVHNENFLKNGNVINYFKIRYSLGNPGNQNIDAKTVHSVYTYYTSYPNMFGLASVVSKWGNKDLKWQRTMTQNIGFDIEIFDSRFRLTADYTYKNSDPILLSITQPTSTGVETIPMNIGATKNNSYSLMAIYQIIRQRDWRWQVNFNLLHTRTKYHKIGTLLEKYNEEGRENQSLRRYYDGVSSTAIWAVKSMGIDPMTGDEVFQRKDGSYTYNWDSNEEIIVGDTNPDFEGNFGSTVRYKGFSLGVNFRYRYGGQMFLSTLFNKVEGLSASDLQYNQDKRALYDRWQKTGDVAKFKRIDDTSLTNMSSRFVADDNTLECKSISLGYETTNATWLKPIGLSSLTFRVYMNDIFRVSTVKEERGLDYPFQRAVSASLSVRF